MVCIISRAYLVTIWQIKIFDVGKRNSLSVSQSEYFHNTISNNFITLRASMFNEATFQEIPLPSLGNVNDYVVHI